MVGLLGCDGPAALHADGGHGEDAGSGQDAGAAADAGPEALHGCADEDFLDRSTTSESSRMIMIPRGTTRFDFPCMTVRAGQAVMFMWDFTAHPLVPGVAPGRAGAGTEPSPIEPQTAGSLYTPAFPAAGDYPFHCNMHHDLGMVGVVRVLP